MIGSMLSALMLAASPPVPARNAVPADPVLRTLLHGDVAQASGDHAALLDTAQLLATLGATPLEGQPDLAAVWTQEANVHGVKRAALAFRGRALGPAYRRGSLVPGGTLSMFQLFLGGQRARISIAPAGDNSKLSIRVQGQSGETLCDKPVETAQADCAWMPTFTDRYTITIENGGEAAASFFLVLR
ncbi:hypothetical protein J3E64_000006 [Sphingobium sp. OAS761]|uniref:hypothetical protein n=1 Tax=Sphingobium sp. OAS761 TaxID=2817901 RepID=UPI00209E2EBF|nr:hypothetical protein [Sphingobium sp. OAS761]MCP1468339.1 hypothetical protein [Sphingobium sp. OAS761]